MSFPTFKSNRVIGAHVQNFCSERGRRMKLKDYKKDDYKKEIEKKSSFSQCNKKNVTSLQQHKKVFNASNKVQQSSSKKLLVSRKVKSQLIYDA